MGLVSSLFGKGNKSAYDTSGLANATNQSNELYKQVYGDAISAGSPWLELGQQGAAGLSSQLGSLTTPFSLDQFNTDPSYQFLQDEAAKAVERSASARGSLFAPSTAKALQDRSAALASTEYGNAFNRNQSQNQSIYDMLMGVSNVGQNQAAQNAQSGWNYADAISGNNIGLQNAILGANQSKNANTQSMLGNWINLGAKVGAAAAGAPSDRRIKENIVHIGEENGYPIYEFNYLGIPDKRFIGVMAQDVQEIMPEAVVEQDGILRVYYDKIGVTMREVE